jgi:hypothetical protein
VVDRLRWLLDRPLRDGDRPRLFVLAAAMIVTVAVAPALVDDLGPAPMRARTEPDGPRPADAATGTPAAPPSAIRTAGASAEGRRAPEPTATRADVARAKRVARTFLRGYLRFAYGRGTAGAIAGGTDELRRRLAQAPPRVPAEERRRRPRAVLVQSDGVSRTRARLRALVRDGGRHYTVPLELARTRAGWRVASVGS